MVEEIGTVIRSNGGKARVQINRSEKCAGCHGCLLSEGREYLTVEAADPLGASSGDRVKIESSAGSAAKSGFILYILPLMALFFGYLTGSKLVSLMGSSSTEGWGILSGFLFMGLTYGAIYLFQKRIVRNRSLQMRVVKILGNAESNEGPMIEKRSGQAFSNRWDATKTRLQE
jgi:sigma-E factor negative regulatory protein RseC